MIKEINKNQIVGKFETALAATVEMLKKEKYSIINEDDFKCYLFANLVTDNFLGKEFESNGGEKLKIVHSKYYHPNANGSGAGSFDIGVLDPNRLDEDINEGNRSICNRKPVLIGCEIKWRRNCYKEYIEYWIRKDALKFVPNKKLIKFASKLGYVIYVHFADKKMYQHNEKELRNLRKFMQDMKIKLSQHGIKIKIVYLQISKIGSKFGYKIIKV